MPERFSAAYRSDNPFETRDEELRGQVEQWIGKADARLPDFRAIGSPLKRQILQRGAVRIGFDAGFLPFEMTDKKGRFVGFDLDIAGELAKAMGVRLEPVNTAWNGIIPSLITDRFDMILSGMTITKERAQKVDFTDPYFVTGQTVILDKRHAGKVRQISDLNHPGYRIASKLGTTGELAVKRLLPQSRYMAYETEKDAASAVLDGKADAFVYDLPFCIFFMATKNNGQLVLLDTPVTRENLGIALRKGDPAMLDWLNAFLSELRRTGRYQQIYDRWFRRTDWASEFN